MIATGILAIVIGYLLGSIPFAYIAGRLVKGIDIWQVGGKNVGTLNTMREAGTVAGLVVLLADMGKGALGILVAQWLNASLIFVYLTGFSAVIGHWWPIFLKFRGGKGAATTIGVLFALSPVATAISFTIIVIVVFATSNFTFAMAIGLALLPLIMWPLGEAGSLITYAITLPIFCSLKYIPTFKKTVSSAEGRQNIIRDKRYKPWQTRRKK